MHRPKLPNRAARRTQYTFFSWPRRNSVSALAIQDYKCIVVSVNVNRKQIPAAILAIERGDGGIFGHAGEL